MSRFINPIPQFIKANGDIVAGGQLFFYESGTDTLLTIYSTVNEDVAIANPVSLGSRGEVPNIFFSASARCVLLDGNGVQIFDVDPVNSDSGVGEFEVWNSNIVYKRNDIVFGNNNQPYISLIEQNQGNEPTLNAGNNNNWTQLLLLEIYNASSVYAPNEYVVADGVIYRSLIDSNQDNNPITDNGENWKSIANAIYTDYDNVASGLVAVTAQGAIDEIVSLINNLPSSVVYRGQLDVSAGDASLPASPQNGDLYVIAVSGTITVSTAGAAPVATVVDVGEQIIYNGDELQWDLIAQVTQASSISYNNATSGLAATDVQTAVDEVEARVQANEGNISSNDTDISNLQGRANSLEAFEASAGTAYTQDVQTSPTDTTAEALMEVGAFGLGSSASGIPWPNTSVNNITGIGSGFYRVDTTNTDTPSVGTYNMIFIRAVAGSVINSQLLIQVDNGLTDIDRMYTRTSDGGTEASPTWSTWKQLIISSTFGNVGIGTDDPSASLEIASVSGSALKVTTGNSDFAVKIESADTGSYISFSDIMTTSSNSVSVGALGDEMLFYTGALAAERMRIDDTGNVGIGVTPSAWDLSGGNVLQIDNAFVYSFGADQVSIGVNTYFDGTNFRYIDAGSNEASLYSQSSGTHRFSTAPANTAGNVTTLTEAMRIDLAGNVGIGTTTPSTKLEVSGDITITDASTVLQMSANAGSFNAVNFGDNVADFVGQILYNHANDAMSFTANGSERMRIDSSGNLLVGTTTPYGSDGVTIAQTGQIFASRTSTNAVDFNREGTDGGVLLIKKNDTTIGALGASGGDFTFGSGAAGVERMRISSTGNVGIGTTSPSTELHVGNTSTSAPAITIQSSTTGASAINMGDTDINAGRIIYNNNSNLMQFVTNGAEQMRITSTGNVGIGTNSPTADLSVGSTSTTTGSLALRTTRTTFDITPSNSDGGGVLFDLGWAVGGQGSFRWATSGTERMRITSGGDLAIGKTNPTTTVGTGHGFLASGAALHTRDGAVPLFLNRLTSDGVILEFLKDSALIGTLGASGGDFIFGTGGSGTERMRIDSIGNMLVGKTATNLATEGVELLPTGIFSTANSNTPLFLNRNTSDGEIIRLRKDNATIGTIGAASSNIYIGQGDAGLYFDAGANAISPINPTTRLNSDNLLDLGKSAARFKDVYAANGTIQTSDIRKKQDIKDLDEAETRVARKAKKLLKSYRWKDAVEAKGDDARIHFGIMAQELEQAFKDEGLDANRYAMFTYDEWVDEKTGEKQDIYGIRYEQLLAFIIGAL